MPPVSLPQSHAPLPLTPSLRTDLYAALLSTTGISTIESNLTHILQESGWLDRLKAYMQYLLREGLVTSHPELMERVLAKIRDANEGDADGDGGGANGASAGTGTGGAVGGEGEDIDLRLPERVMRDGVRVVRGELEKVCELVS